MSHLQNCSLKIYLKRALGGGGGGGGRVEGGRGGFRMDVDEELKFLGKSKKKNFFLGGGGVGGGVGLRGSG